MQTKNIDLARALRLHLTRSEKILWRQLRGRKLCGLKFRRQQPLGSYILDFFCAEKGLVVELDGGQHDFPENREYDEKRTAYLNAQELVVLRFWNSQIRGNLPWVLELIRQKAGMGTNEEQPTPHPNPLPQGEREGSYHGELPSAPSPSTPSPSTPSPSTPSPSAPSPSAPSPLVGEGWGEGGM